jgi:hypothetical protein
MAVQLTKTTKLLVAVLGVIIITGVLVLVITGTGIASKKSPAGSITITSAKLGESSRTSSTIKLTQEEEFSQLAQDKNFVSIFNDFEYSGAVIKEAKLIEKDGSMFYIVLETKDSFDKVDNFYKLKKIQSIWSRSEIFEATSQELEDLFLNEDADSSQSTQGRSQYFKYSFISESKDQLLNVLARSYSQELTQIMIIYWKLSN